MSSYHDKFKELLRLDQGPEPLNWTGKEAQDYEAFLKAISDVRVVADRYNLKKIEFTNFVMFGPQSAGKTTLVERILGFPLSVVRQGTASTRPLVLTTVRSKPHDATDDGIKVTVRGEDGVAKILARKDVMKWVAEQMDGRFSTKEIYIEVEGPNCRNHRFVDLPGFKLHDVQQDPAKIINLLEVEIQKPNTVVVCVEEATAEFNESPLKYAIDEVLKKKSNLPSSKFIFAFNKSDEWLEQGVTGGIFLEELTRYGEDLKLVPILVGGSVDKKAALARQNGTATFDEIVRMYEGADERERKICDDFFWKEFRATGRSDPASDLYRANYCGFPALLGTIDALIVARDLENAKKNCSTLENIVAEIDQQIENCKKSLLLLGYNNTTKDNGDEMMKYLKRELNRCVLNLNSILNQVMGTASGTAMAVAAASNDEMTKCGLTALQEEQKFVDNYYKPAREYRNHEIFAGSEEMRRTTDPGTLAKWQKQVVTTMKTLETARKTKELGRGRIDYLDTPLISGQIYERALGIWASSVFDFLLPSFDDLIKIANIVGTSHELKDPKSQYLRKAKRLAENYVGELDPALKFLCQKVEFLMLHCFETAWRTFCKNENNIAFIKAVGKESLHMHLRECFRNNVHKASDLAYSRSRWDLDSEIHKLLPYQDSETSMAAMALAFPDFEEKLDGSQAQYVELIEEKGGIINTALNKCLDNISKDAVNPLRRGVELGMKLMVLTSGIDPLMFASFHILESALQPIVKKAVKSRFSSTERPQSHYVPASPRRPAVEDNDDIELLGLAVALYARCVHRFIAAADGRMRSDLWASINNTHLLVDFQCAVESSPVIANLAERVTEITNEIGQLEKQRSELIQARECLESIAEKRDSELIQARECLESIAEKRDKFHRNDLSYDDCDDDGGDPPPTVPLTVPLDNIPEPRPVVLIVTTADAEFDAVLYRLAPPPGQRGPAWVAVDTHSVCVGELGDHVVVAVCKTRQGTLDTHAVVSQLLSNDKLKDSVKVVFAVGIAWGCDPAPTGRTDQGQMIGDVLVADMCLDASRLKNFKGHVELRGAITIPCRLAMTIDQCRCRTWPANKEAWSGRARPPRAQVGTIVSQPVLHSDGAQATAVVTHPQISPHNPIGGEMELYQICSCNKPWMLAKAVSDFGGLTGPKTNDGHAYAAANAADFADWLLRQPPMLAFLAQRG